MFGFYRFFKNIVVFWFVCVKLCWCLIIHLMCVATISYPYMSMMMIIHLLFGDACYVYSFISFCALHQVVCDMEE